MPSMPPISLGPPKPLGLAGRDLPAGLVQLDPSRVASHRSRLERGKTAAHAPRHMATGQMFAGYLDSMTLLISSSECSLPRLQPGQFRKISFQSRGDATLDSQKGQVRHCMGLASYTEQRLDSGSRKMQSPSEYSTKLIFGPIRLVNRLSNPSRSSPHPHRFRNPSNLLFRHPHEPSTWPAATINALRAFKRKAVLVPIGIRRVHAESVSGAGTGTNA
jgi:hypothetical protein